MTRSAAELNALIRPLRGSRYEVDAQFTYFEEFMRRWAKDYDGLEMNPDFQRGHVWTEVQQQRFIENVLRGVVPSSGFLVQFNCPNWEMEHHDYQGELPRGLQCIDGLQRITAILKFLAGEIHPFGLNVDELRGTNFSMKRSLYRIRIAVYDFQTRAELLQHYLDFNAGGTIHSDSEIQRVAQLLEECRPPDLNCAVGVSA